MQTLSIMRQLVLLFAFASGACALIYEVAWVRVLSLDFGVTVYAMSCVLSVFMAGMAIGHKWFGHRADQARNLLRWYAGIELALAAFAAVFVVIQPGWHGVTAWSLQSLPQHSLVAGCTRLLLTFALLFPPTFLMGGTLPVLAKFSTVDARSRGRWLSRLYGINALGAVVGCLLVSYVLILKLGMIGSILLAASVNATIGFVCLVLARQIQPAPMPKVPSAQLATDNSARTSDRPAISQSVLIAAFASGFVSLAAEVLWTRLFINFLTSNVLVVTTILGGFLSGIALGSLLMSRWLDRIARLDQAVGHACMAGALVLAGSVLGQGALGNLFASIHRGNRDGLPDDTAVQCLLALFALITIAATVLGILFPMILRWSSSSLASLGRDVGRVLAWNTVGAIAGSIAAGFVLIALLGVNCSLLSLAAMYCAIALPFFNGVRCRALAVFVLLGCLTLAALPSWQRPIFWFNGGFTGVRQIPAGETLFLQEGVEATVGVAQRGAAMSLSVNGIVVAETTRHDIWDLLLKAHLPMLLHQDPQHVALIGLGAGISLGAVAAYDVRQIDCIELSSEVVAAHRHFAAYNNRCWQEPRLRMIVGDGRHHLHTSRQKYDVINVDPTDPPVSYQYTQDLFRLSHARLKPGGLMVQWVPLFHLRPLHVRVILQAFHRVFPHTTIWYDGTSLLLIGCRGGPLQIDARRFLQRARQPAVADSLALIGRPHPLVLLNTYVAGPRAIKSIVGADVPDNTDDRPYLEYRLFLSGPVPASETAANLKLLLIEFVQPLANWLPVSQLSEAELTMLKRLRALMPALMWVRILELRGEHQKAEAELTQIRERFGLTEEDVELFQPFIKP